MIKTFCMLILLVVCCSGCASMYVYDQNARECALEKAHAKGDQNAIQFIAMGGSAFGAAVDLNNLDPVKKHPVKTFMAAALDVGMGLVAKEAYDSMTDNRHYTVVYQNGDNNTATTQ